MARWSSRTRMTTATSTEKRRTRVQYCSTEQCRCLLKPDRSQPRCRGNHQRKSEKKCGKQDSKTGKRNSKNEVRFHFARFRISFRISFSAVRFRISFSNLVFHISNFVFQFPLSLHTLRLGCLTDETLRAAERLQHPYSPGSDSPLAEGRCLFRP